MRLKSELYKKEQVEICDKIIEILDLPETNTTKVSPECNKTIDILENKLENLESKIKTIVEEEKIYNLCS